MNVVLAIAVHFAKISDFGIYQSCWKAIELRSEFQQQIFVSGTIR